MAIRNLKSSSERARGSWLLSYGDVATLLICFFIMMLISRSGEISKVHRWVYHRLEESSIELQEITSQFENHSIAVSHDTKGIRLTLRNPNMFDLGKAEPLPLFRTQLNVLAKTISELKIFHLNTVPDYDKWLNNFDKMGLDWNVEIRVEGHTDNIPLLAGSDYRNNWELSAARAQSIMRIIHEYSELPESHFAIAGFGEFRPLTKNISETDREMNRRVEIFVNASLVKKS